MNMVYIEVILVCHKQHMIAAFLHYLQGVYKVIKVLESN